MNKIPQMRPYFNQDLSKDISEYLKDDVFITEYKKTTDFEEEITKFTGIKNAIAVNNGTIALTLAGLCCDLKPGDEVLIPNFTMIATCNAFRILGAKIKLIDIDKENLCICKSQVEEQISSKTKIVVLVNANGRYPSFSVEQWRQDLNKKGIYLIEDAAQALGSKYPNGDHIGMHSNISTLSFSAPKIISTGQGGMLLTNNDDIAKKARKIKDFGRNKGGTDIHDITGFNFKFTDIQAVIGLNQMKELNSRINKKKNIYKIYAELFNEIPEVDFIKNDIKVTTPWFFEIKVEKRKQLINFLKEKGIGSRVMYPALHTQQCNQGLEFGFVKNSLEISKKGLWIPSMHTLTIEEIERICCTIKEFFYNE